MRKQEFEAELIKDEDPKGGVGIKIPFNVQEAFGSKSPVKVKCTTTASPIEGPSTRMAASITWG